MVSGSYECTKTFIQDICHLYLLLSTEEGPSCSRDKANWLMMWLIPWLTTRHVNCHIDVLCALAGADKARNSHTTEQHFLLFSAYNTMTHEINFPCVIVLLAEDSKTVLFPFKKSFYFCQEALRQLGFSTARLSCFILIGSATIGQMEGVSMVERQVIN